MKSLLFPSTTAGSIEPLEARIAPAAIRIGASGVFEDFTDTEYREVVDPNDPDRGPRPEEFNKLAFTDTSNSTDAISLAVDTDGLLTDNTFFLRLQAGDTVFRLTEGSNYKEFVIVKSGQAVAFFTDLNFNNEFDEGEFTGLSLGQDAVVEVNGSVNGDIVTNLNERSTKDRADDTMDMAGLVSSKQGIKSLSVLGGSVFGNVISGGDIKSLTVATNVANVFAGAAGLGTAFDFFKGPVGGGAVNSFTLAPKQLGASISNVSIGALTRVDPVTGDPILDAFGEPVPAILAAGAGGAGAKGGSLIGIQIISDTNGFELAAGEGGNGSAAGKVLNGGLGGEVMNVFVGGIDDDTPNSANGIIIRSGGGGDAEPTGKGGAGGQMKNINVGYFPASNKVPIPSAQLLSDNVTIAAGDGGAGKTGGAGAAITGVKVRIQTPDVQGNEIDVQSGDGGDSITPGGVAGAGGLVRDLELRNQITTPNGDIFVRAGNGGGGGTQSKGAMGGSVTNLTALGFDIQVLAGDGSDGTVGGAAGSVTGVTANREGEIVPRNILINAGHGGTGFVMNGGNGGEVKGITAANGDFESILINVGIAGDGGAALGLKTGKGGKGGGVSTVTFTDADSVLGLGAPIEGQVTLRSGRGGEGTTGGGVAGNMDKVAVTGDNLHMTAIAGAGGDALTKGNGGAGGFLSAVQIKSTGSVAGVASQGTLQAGDGGDGFGAAGAGGAGGDVRNESSVVVDGDGRILAGQGGNGQNTTGAIKGGAAGKGGSIVSSGLFAKTGLGEMIAGDAGIGGAKAAAGGSITQTSNTQIGLRAHTSITAMAGDGSHGGQGGDIIGLSYGSTTVSLSPTPSGSILFQAGQGSAEGAIAGRGGNITNANGSVSSGANQTTRFVAGDGGGTAFSTKSGAGGTIKDITIARGGSVGGVLTFEAGDAGDAPLSSKGAAGGNVENIGVTDITAATIFRSVAAGDGGDGKTAGPGGSIKGVDVQNHDIGVRTGEKFGYTTQGGLFAGVAGVSGPGGKAAVNGSVSGVTADSISSIVAGRIGAPHLAEKVSDIYIAGTQRTQFLVSNQSLVPNGDFVLRFGGEQTPVIESGSTAAEVQAALNLLNGIAAAGGVTVLSTATAGYSITFNQPGNQPLLSGLEIVNGDIDETIKGSTGVIDVNTDIDGESTLPVTEVRSGQSSLVVIETNPGTGIFSTSEQVGGDAITNEIQLLDIGGLSPFPTGTFTLTFDSSTTTQLPVTATAAQIEAALNVLPSVLALGPNNDGSVTVVAVPNETGRFTITFAQVGAQDTIIGTRLVPEVQRLNLGEVTNFANAQFTLTFEGETTVSLPSTATAADIKAALDNLLTIQAIAVGDGAVKVTALGGGQFDITFINKVSQVGLNGDQTPISGVGLLPELQRLNLGTLPTVPGATFTVSAGIEKTAPIPANASASQIAAAINSLPSIQAVGGVTVVLGINGAVNISFSQIGDQLPLTAEGLQKEQQSIDLDDLTGANSEFTLAVQHPLEVLEVDKGVTLNFPSTDTAPAFVFTDFASTEVTPGALPPPVPGTAEIQQINLNGTVPVNGQFVLDYAGQTTVPILANATAADIEAALDALPAILALAPAGVTVAPNGAGIFRITFPINAGNVTPITGTSHLRVPQPGEFTVNATTVTNGTPTLAEVQRLNVVKTLVLGGNFSLEFAGQTTGVIGAPNGIDTLALDIEQALNALVAISELGGVTVTEVPGANGLPGSNLYNVNFSVAGTQPQIAMTSRVPETQQFNLGAFAANPTGEFTLTFNGQTTNVLTTAATADEVATELNLLGSIVAQGGVTVRGTAGNFSILFNDVGFPANQPAVIVAAGGETEHEHQVLDLGSLTAYSSGFFQLNFGGQKTVPLPVNATAAQIEAALNDLPAVQDTRTGPLPGTVSVTDLTGGRFDIEFNIFGDQQEVSAQGVVTIDRYPILVSETTSGSQLPVIVSETRAGSAFGVPVTELVAGGAATKEVQRVDLATLAGATVRDFTLGFGPLSTASLPVEATPQQVQAALNALTTIQLAGGVTVAAGPGTSFDITFGNNGDQVSIVALARLGETQTVDLGALTGLPGGEFTLSLGGYTTAPISVAATPAEVKTALDALPSVANFNGVLVAAAGAGKFAVTFLALGDVASMTGFGGGTAGHETQQISIGSLLGVTDGSFKLTFNGQSTAPIAATATPAEVAAALNALDSVKDTRPDQSGAVTVTAGAAGVFNLTFNTFGDQPLVTGKSLVTSDRVFGSSELRPGSAASPVPVAETTPGGAAVKEVQTIDLTDARAANQEFQLRFDNNPSDPIPAGTTAILAANSTAAQIQTALNAIATVTAAGGVTVTDGPVGSDDFVVTFNNNGNQQAIGGFSGVHEQQTVDLIAASLSSTSVPNGLFRLTFNGEATRALKNSASAAEVEAALDALASIKALRPDNLGGVTVAETSEDVFQIDFSDLGNFNAIGGIAAVAVEPALDTNELVAGGNFALVVTETIAGGATVNEVQHIDTSLLLAPGGSSFTLTFGGATTAPLAEAATAAQVQTALNGLGTIVGGVTVTQVGSGFDVRFNDVGAQGDITGAATLFESQVLDLQKLPSVENAQIRLSFGGQTTAPIAATAASIDIENVLNALSSVQALGPGNNVNVFSVAPGVFRIDFTVAGNQTPITGTFNSFGTTERLPGAAAPEAIDAALDSVSFFDIDVAAGTPAGTVLVSFQESGDQPEIVGVSYIHEQQRVDVYADGTFVLSYGDDSTAPLPPDATAEQIRAALNTLPNVIAAGGVTKVIIGENSSFSVIFGSDEDSLPLRATQTLQPIPIFNPANGDGTATRREVQIVEFVKKNAFVENKFITGNFVGAIYDFNEIDSNTFHFIEQNGLPGFNEGDMPIDGIVMAKILDQATINFTPEAKFTATGFFDYDNKL